MLSGHPRWGGELIGFEAFSQCVYGSSPLGRGTHLRQFYHQILSRVIPAGAGNSWDQTRFVEVSAGHPRWGGELARSFLRQDFRFGSSPLGRGTRQTGWSGRWRCRVIPAGAGNSPPDRRPNRRRSGHPRWGGELQFFAPRIPDAAGSSPLGRGTLPHHRRSALTIRVIPAGAGNSLRRQNNRLLDPGHPRWGGELGRAVSKRPLRNGSSPLGRGTR